MQRIGSLFFCRIDKMGVNLGGLYVCMPHQGLNRVDVYAIFKQQRGVAMASTMEQNPQSSRRQTSDDKT